MRLRISPRALTTSKLASPLPYTKTNTHHRIKPHHSTYLRSHPFTTTPPYQKMADPISKPPSLPSNVHLSSTYGSEQAANDLASLLKPSTRSDGEDDKRGGRWTLSENGMGLERTFKFKGFKKCWEFMDTVARECVKAKHHPEWSNMYNTTFIRWTTHQPRGLSELDVKMARFCDEVAGGLGEVRDEDGKEGGEGGVGKGLVDRVVVEGGDCCVPKKL